MTPISPMAMQERAICIYDVNSLYGFFSAFGVFVVLNTIWPASETLIDECIVTDEETLEGQSMASDQLSFSNKGAETKTKIEAF